MTDPTPASPESASDARPHAFIDGDTVGLIDLSELPPGIRTIDHPSARRKVTYTWGHTVVGEHLVSLEAGAPQEHTLIPATVHHQAAVLRASERLRPILAPRVEEPAQVSVVICTLRRSDALDRCLRSLLCLHRSPDEILVVNNDPSDRRTRCVAEALGARVIDEPRRGLSAARNAGIRASRNPFVAFIDDDCVVDPGWLDRVSQEFKNPLTAACVGYVGPAELVSSAQILFEAQGGFERHVSHHVADPVGSGPWAAVGFGDGNAVFRRSVFERHGGFAEDLGPGTPARSAQDSEMFHRLSSYGYRVSFSPSQIAWHAHRREFSALSATLEGYATGLSAHAARTLVHSRDPAALRIWWWWFAVYLPRLARMARSRKYPGAGRLLLSQFRGAVLGPWRDRRHLMSPLPIPSVAMTPAASSPPRLEVQSDSPSISVAIASRNRRDQLVRGLRALAEQDCPPEGMEVVVVLDGSTDGSYEAVNSLDVPWPLRVEAKPPSGLATARNHGVAMSRHPLVLFLDDDIVGEPGLITAHRRAHERSRDVIVMGYHPPVAPSTWWGHSVAAWWHDHFARLGHPGWRPDFVDYADGNSSVARKTFLDVGGFDPVFSGGRRQDWEFAIRALCAGVELGFARNAVAEHHPDCTLTKALAASRDEGRFDAVICRKHPLASGRLPLSTMAALPRTALRFSGLDDSFRQWALLAAACERAGSYRAWSRVVSLAHAAAYADGVYDSVSPTELPKLLAPVDREDDLRVASLPDGRQPASNAEKWPPDWHLGRLDIAIASQRFTPTEPGSGWDPEHVLDLAVHAVVDTEEESGQRGEIPR